MKEIIVSAKSLRQGFKITVGFQKSQLAFKIALSKAQ
jgi:hypothetical protein